MMIVYKRRQKNDDYFLFKPQDSRLARNLATKKVMAAELESMGLELGAIARLLNLHQEKEG